MKRGEVPFDDEYFKKQQKSGIKLNAEEKFREIHKTNHWSSDQSVSGQGSDIDQTATIREALPELLKELDVKIFLDAPCGDFNWLANTDLPVTQYIGGDIVPEIISKNQQNFDREDRAFLQLNLISDSLPGADLMFCRDCLVHLSNADIFNAIDNIKSSNIKYLLTTSFPGCEKNDDIVTGDWRIINLQINPFNFPEPLEIINEDCTEGDGSYADKSLVLWKVSDL